MKDQVTRVINYRAMTINMIAFGVFSLQIFFFPIKMLKIYKKEGTYMQTTAIEMLSIKRIIILAVSLSVISQFILIGVF